MRKLCCSAARGLALGALAVLLAVGPEGYAQDGRPRGQSNPADAAKKVPELIAALKDRSYYPNRYRAAKDLGELGPAARDAVPALAAALNDPEPLVRMAAAGALGRVGIFSREALLVFKTAAKDESPQVRDTATEASERLLARAANKDVPALVAALKDSEPSVRRAAIRGLGKVGSVSPEMVALLKAAEKDESPAVRDAAAEASEGLPSRATEEDLPILVAVAKDAEPSVRRAAARALGKAGSGFLTPSALAALEGLAKDKDPDVRHAAKEALEAIPPSVVTLARQLPVGETYLEQGRLPVGEAVLLERLKKAPRDDQARFALGLLRFVRGIERLSQSQYKYGFRVAGLVDPTILFFDRLNPLLLPVPENRNPAPLSYSAFRGVLDGFLRDLSAAEAALAGVSDDKVKLPLRLALIRLDLDGDGKATDKFIDMLETVRRRPQPDFLFDFLKANPHFLVCFDRGDVAWLRAYCHLLMGMLEFCLAFDTEPWFDRYAHVLFANPERARKGEQEAEVGKVIAVKEPARLGRFRKHLIQVAALNRETWKYIRAETDDDHEWLPHPRQHGVLVERVRKFGIPFTQSQELPVGDAMIDAWLAMMDEWKALLDGKRTLTTRKNEGFIREGKGLNLKALFDDPPEEFALDAELLLKALPEKYFSERRDVDPAFRIFLHPAGLNWAFGIFLNPEGAAFAAGLK